MDKLFCLGLLLALAGCANLPAPTDVTSTSPCAAGEATYACQVERYFNVSVP